MPRLHDALETHARVARDYRLAAVHAQTRAAEVFGEVQHQLRGWALARATLERQTERLLGDLAAFEARLGDAAMAADHAFVQR